MKTNARLFLILTVFYLLDAVVYGYWSYSVSKDKNVEIIGTAAIGMLVFLSGFIYFYINKTAKVMGNAPEDRLDANIEDGEAEIGFYSPWSWWPFMLGIGGAIAFASLAIGPWMTFIGIPVALVALVGFVFEYSRGQHAH